MRQIASPVSSKIDWEKIDRCCSYKMTKEDTAFLGNAGNPQTLLRAIKERYGCDYVTFRDQRLSRTRYELINKAIEMAKGGSIVMLIFTLKNLCKWSDNP